MDDPCDEWYTYWMYSFSTGEERLIPAMRVVFLEEEEYIDEAGGRGYGF